MWWQKINLKAVSCDRTLFRYEHIMAIHPSSIHIYQTTNCSGENCKTVHIHTVCAALKSWLFKWVVWLYLTLILHKVSTVSKMTFQPDWNCSHFVPLLLLELKTLLQSQLIPLSEKCLKNMRIDPHQEVVTQQCFRTEYLESTIIPLLLPSALLWSWKFAKMPIGFMLATS